MSQLFTNNANTVLSASLTNIATSLSVTAGTGNKFPSIPTVGEDYFLLTLFKITVDGETSHEIVKVTQRTVGAPDTFIIVRAQEGTTALAFASGDRAELRITKGTMERALMGDTLHILTAKSAVIAGTLTVDGNVTLGTGIEDEVIVNADLITHTQRYTRNLLAGAMPSVTQTFAGQTYVEGTAHADGTSNFIANERATVANGSNHFTAVQGDRVNTRVTGSINVTTMTGSNALNAHNSTGSVVTSHGYLSYQQVINTGNITTYNGYNVNTPYYSSTGRITTLRGVNVADLGHADSTTAVGVLVANFTPTAGSVYGFKADMSAGTNKWAYFAGGGANSAFLGAVRIGSVAAPTTTLDVTGSFQVSGGATFNDLIAANANYVAANANAAIELGSPSTNTPYIDFHSGATLVDYDARIMASGGTGVTGKGQLTITSDKIFWGGASLENARTISFVSQPAITTTTGAVTVNWLEAQNQKQNEPTGAITYTFTAPPGPCHVQLLIDSDGTSTAQTITWPGTVIWLGGIWTGLNNKKAVINFWYDGTNYYAMGVNQV